MGRLSGEEGQEAGQASDGGGGGFADGEAGLDHRAGLDVEGAAAQLAGDDGGGIDLEMAPDADVAADLAGDPGVSQYGQVADQADRGGKEAHGFRFHSILYF